MLTRSKVDLATASITNTHDCGCVVYIAPNVLRVAPCNNNRCGVFGRLFNAPFYVARGVCAGVLPLFSARLAHSRHAVNAKTN